MTNEIILYNTPEGDKKVGVLYHDENFWLTQKAIAQLFNVEVPAISKHLGNIYDSGELEREATVSILETVRTEGCRVENELNRVLEYTDNNPFKCEFDRHDQVVSILERSANEGNKK